MVDESYKKTFLFILVEVVSFLIVGFFTKEFISAFAIAAIVGNLAIIHNLRYEFDKIKINHDIVCMGLTEGVLNDKSLGDSIKKLNTGISKYCEYRKTLDEEFKKFADDTIKYTAESFVDLSTKEQLTIRYEDIREYGRYIMDQAKEGDELWATSLIYSPCWWQGKAGDEYVQKKLDVAAKKVNVKQIFLEGDEKSLRNDEKIIKKLAGGKGNSNVPEVYAIAVSKINDKDKLRDFLILRKKIAFELKIDDKYWIKGFSIYFEGSEKLKELEAIYNYFLNERKSDVIKYDSTTYSKFDKFVKDVFN